MDKQIGLMERQDHVRDLAAKIARERLAPDAAEYDQSGGFPLEAIRFLGEVGLPGLILSEAEGGAGAGRTCFASVVQEISMACASTALVYTSHVIAAKAIEVGGKELLKQRLLPATLQCRALGAFAVHEPGSGSNAGAITTRAARDGDFYIVNGSKFFITSGGEADVYLVLVRTDPEKGPRGDEHPPC